MVKRYYGGVISATQAVANATSASGFFNTTQQMQAKNAGKWPSPPDAFTVEYLVVAGGGGGGYDNGGGGGAGGFRTASGFAVLNGSPITVTVGAGGIGGRRGARAGAAARVELARRQPQPRG